MLKEAADHYPISTKTLYRHLVYQKLVILLLHKAKDQQQQRSHTQMLGLRKSSQMMNHKLMRTVLLSVHFKSDRGYILDAAHVSIA